MIRDEIPKRHSLLVNPMPDLSQIVRQWTILKLLSSRRLGITIRELIDLTGAGDKTIRRDLIDLKAAGFPINEEQGEFNRKSYRLPDSAHVPAGGLTFDEALSLYLGRRLLDPLQGTLIGASLRRAFQKLEAMLGSIAADYLAKMAVCFHVTGIAKCYGSDQGELLDDLMTAVEDHVQTLIVYHPQRATEPVEYEVYPYGFIYHRGSLYLVAHSLAADAIRHFKLDRVSEVTRSGLPFQPPTDFNLAEHLAGSFGMWHGDGDVAVKVRFAPAVARYVEESIWHPSQELIKERDGSVIAEFQLSATEEISRWIISFGPNAEVLEPTSLRAEIAADLERMLANYAREGKENGQPPTSEAVSPEANGKSAKRPARKRIVR